MAKRMITVPKPISFEVDEELVRSILDAHAATNYQAAYEALNHQTPFDWDEAPEGSDYWSGVETDLGNHIPRPDAMARLAGWLLGKDVSYLSHQELRKQAYIHGFQLEPLDKTQTLKPV